MNDIKKIIIGIDNSNYAEHAASYGFKLARTFNAAVGLVHIIEPGAIAPPVPATDTALGLPGFGLNADGISGAGMMEAMQAEESINHDLLQNTIARYGEGLQVTQFSNYGSTADGIIDSSKEFGADLIVIGTHSRTGFDRFVMGSVAERVIRESLIPVLVVPMKTDVA